MLVCDDEELIRWSLRTHLSEAGYGVVEAANGEEALAAAAEHAPALILLDLKMPKLDGMSTLRQLRASGDDTPVVVITAHGGIDQAIEATQLGCNGWLNKPFDLKEIIPAIERTLSEDKLRREVHYLRTRQRAGYGDFIGHAASLAPVFKMVQRLETVDAPTVLIMGDSGTGKDVLAREIHARGPRSAAPFVAIDCAALSENLIESELFGHERGAFTDAKVLKRGLFEVAEGGVVFLDEIGEMAVTTQAKLLRTLENRTFKRVGGVRSIPMNVALVAATNRDLKAEVEAGRFRKDLFFRLAVIPLTLPRLTERTEDIPLLVEHFVDRFNQQFSRNIKGVTGEAMGLLQHYKWPGNVRELRNVLERIVLLGADDLLTPADLPPEIRFAQPESLATDSECPFELPEEGVILDDVERGLILQALDRTEGNQTAAARLLGITRYALRYRMEKYNLEH